MFTIAPRWYNWRYGLLGFLTAGTMPIAMPMSLLLAGGFLVWKKDKPNDVLSWFIGVGVMAVFLAIKYNYIFVIAFLK